MQELTFWNVQETSDSQKLNALKFKVDSVAKLFCDLSPTVLNFYSK